MLFQKKHKSKGQTLVEFGLICTVIVVVCVVAIKVLAPAMGNQISASSKGFSSESHLKK